MKGWGRKCVVSLGSIPLDLSMIFFYVLFCTRFLPIYVVGVKEHSMVCACMLLLRRIVSLALIASHSSSIVNLGVFNLHNETEHGETVQNTYA
jgi:hypothetical protein